MTRLLHEYAARQADERPDAVALVFQDRRVTFGELETESNRIARALKDAGCGRGDRVCLFLPKTPEAIACMLGTLKADCAYVPIDTASPASRVAKIVVSAEPRLVLVASSAARLLDDVVATGELQSIPDIASVDPDPVETSRFTSSFCAADWVAQSPEPLDWQNTADDPAHLLFTSGSTGTPKGVVITHANVVAFVEWAIDYFGAKPGDRVSGHPPLHFDLSTFDIYGSLLAGAELHLVPSSYNLLPQNLANLIRSAELTQWFSVPSTMTYMAKAGVVQPGSFPSLDRVLWCGEVLPTPILIHWMRAVPQARFTNLYGPTEATIASSYYTVPAIPGGETDPIPIGMPCAGEELLVLDESRAVALPGVTGDLYIGGVGLSPGYWRDEEKTRAAFVPDARSADPDARIYRTGDLARVGEDGLVYFLGRADSQIKSRGYRIELGEIETAMNALADVRECAVVGVDTGGFEGTTICCAYAPKDGRTLEPATAGGELRRALPAYMIPARWLVLDALPKNVNGKIDRRSIRESFEAQLAAHEGEPGVPEHVPRG